MNTPEEFLSESLRLYHAGLYEQCIEAAEAALRLRPDYSEAWMNICAANNMLGMFGAGKNAGEQALRLSPDSPRVRANLQWSRRELRKVSLASLERKAARASLGPHSARILIAIYTCKKYANRVQAQFDTWVPEMIAAGYDVQVFDGERLGVDDNYDSLSLKTQALCAYAFEHGYDYLFKIDDDVYIRVADFKPVMSDYAGILLEAPYEGPYLYDYAEGPAYWLSARAMKIIVDTPLPKDPHEDAVIGTALGWNGIEVTSLDGEYCSVYYGHPQKQAVVVTQISSPALFHSIHGLKDMSEYRDPIFPFRQSARAYGEGKYEKCIEAAREAIRLMPEYAAAWIILCAAYSMLGQFEEGKKAGEEAVRLDPNNQLAKNNLAWSMRELQNKGHRQQAMTLPVTSGDWLNLSVVHYHAGRFQDTIDAARSALAIQPNLPGAWINICAGYCALGRFEFGRMAGEEAVRLAPNDQLAKNNLAYSRRELNSSKVEERDYSFADGSKPLVRSYDLFDTLIARRCKEPHEIFHLVEKQSGVAGFAEARKEAERAVQQGDYTLDDIYRQLATILPLSASELDSLRSLELSLEKNNFIPIKEMIERLKPGDVIVSDMYLPKDFLAQVIESLVGKQTLYLSSGGKASGEIWSELRHRYEIEAHIGDNHRTDFRSPTRHEIPAFLTSNSSFTPTEQKLHEMGFRGLALTMRESRLSSNHNNPEFRQLQLFQSQNNFPLLFLTSLHLHRRVAQENLRNVLMSSRDCYLWHHLMKAIRDLHQGSYEVTYFLTSRLCRAFPSAAYLEYVNSLLSVPAIVVDLCGTGWSLRRLLARTERSDSPIFLLFLFNNPKLNALYNSFGTADSSIPVSYALHGFSDMVEHANYARHAMVTDVRESDSGFTPVYAAQSNNFWEEIPQIQIQHAAFFHTMSVLHYHDFASDLAASDASIASAMEWCSQSFDGHERLFEYSWLFHQTEEANTMQTLTNLAAARPE